MEQDPNEKISTWIEMGLSQEEAKMAVKAKKEQKRGEYAFRGNGKELTAYLENLVA